MPNPENEKMAALLYQWEEHKQLGEPVTPEALCHDAPELLQELKKRIEVLEHVDELLDLGNRETPGASVLETLCDVGEVSKPDLRFTLEPGAQKVPPEFGNYILLKEIGQGGMGIVYKAHDRGLDKYVALKTLNARAKQNTEYRARFKAEARMLARLHHEHVVKILAWGTHEDQPFFVMDFWENGSVSKKMKNFQEPAKAARLMAQVARGVEYAHLHNIFHRDLKPGNILLGERDRAIVSDFGLAKIISDYCEEPAAATGTTVDYQQGLTAPGARAGTPPYMAPEQFYGGEIGKRIDIWAMGVILFELLTGTRPFQGKTDGEIAKAVTAGLPREPRKIDPRIPAPLSKIIQKCLETDPEKRYADAGALADDLEATLQGKTRRWVLAASGLTLLGGGFEVGRRMKAKRDEDRLDEEFAEKSSQLRDEYDKQGFVELLKEDGTPKAYRWRTGDWRRPLETESGLLLRSRLPEVIDLIDAMPVNRFVIHLKFTITYLFHSLSGRCGVFLSRICIEGKHIMLANLFEITPNTVCPKLNFQETDTYRVSTNTLTIPPENPIDSLHYKRPLVVDAKITYGDNLITVVSVPEMNCQYDRQACATSFARKPLGDDWLSSRRHFPGTAPYPDVMKGGVGIYLDSVGLHITSLSIRSI